MYMCHSDTVKFVNSLKVISTYWRLNGTLTRSVSF